MAVVSIGSCYGRMEEFGERAVCYEIALKGFEAQFGKDHADTKTIANNFKVCLQLGGNIERLNQLISSYPWMLNES
ncbi:hypothetical protein TrLO_g13118 [Triparma laevis f. longispina]|uniref:Uncharacterized protein n=1 Tax=Triparma laevis f. longispina TaxID=1714387 RepID=A0A9W7EBF6_9STRA|nr:hypothetical protein TrLO_g13118 [Triparma laevis f. longispina]